MKNNDKLTKYTKMLAYHRENGGHKATIKELEKEVNYLELQEEAKQRELKLSKEAIPNIAYSKKPNANKPFKVTNRRYKVYFYGTLNECRAFIAGKNMKTLTIKQNKA